MHHSKSGDKPPQYDDVIYPDPVYNIHGQEQQQQLQQPDPFLDPFPTTQSNFTSATQPALYHDMSNLNNFLNTSQAYSEHSVLPLQGLSMNPSNPHTPPTTTTTTTTAQPQTDDFLTNTSGLGLTPRTVTDTLDSSDGDIVTRSFNQHEDTKFTTIDESLKWYPHTMSWTNGMNLITLLILSALLFILSDSFPDRYNEEPSFHTSFHTATNFTASLLVIYMIFLVVWFIFMTISVQCRERSAHAGQYYFMKSWGPIHWWAYLVFTAILFFSSFTIAIWCAVAKPGDRDFTPPQELTLIGYGLLCILSCLSVCSIYATRYGRRLLLQAYPIQLGLFAVGLIAFLLLLPFFPCICHRRRKGSSSRQTQPDSDGNISNDDNDDEEEEEYYYDVSIGGWGSRDIVHAWNRSLQQRKLGTNDEGIQLI